MDSTVLRISERHEKQGNIKEKLVEVAYITGVIQKLSSKYFY